MCSQRRNLDIIVTKWIGLEGSYLLSKENEPKLRGRFPKWLVDRALSFGELISVDEELKAARDFGAKAIVTDVSQGIFAGLWELAQGLDKGMEIDFKSIPIRQETVEICEFLKENPYELSSNGSIIAAMEDARPFAKALRAKGIDCAIIGNTADSKDRVLIDGDRKRFLEATRKGDAFCEGANT